MEAFAYLILHMLLYDLRPLTIIAAILLLLCMSNWRSEPQESMEDYTSLLERYGNVARQQREQASEIYLHKVEDTIRR